MQKTEGPKGRQSCNFAHVAGGNLVLTCIVADESEHHEELRMKKPTLKKVKVYMLGENPMTPGQGPLTYRFVHDIDVDSPTYIETWCVHYSWQWITVIWLSTPYSSPFKNKHGNLSTTVFPQVPEQGDTFCDRKWWSDETRQWPARPLHPPHHLSTLPLDRKPLRQLGTAARNQSRSRSPFHGQRVSLLGIRQFPKQ